jgi:hypothetical protein
MCLHQLGMNVMVYDYSQSRAGVPKVRPAGRMRPSKGFRAPREEFWKRNKFVTMM